MSSLFIKNMVGTSRRTIKTIVLSPQKPLPKYIPQMVTGGNKTSDEYDYDADYLENGMTFFENLQKTMVFKNRT